MVRDKVKIAHTSRSGNRSTSRGKSPPSQDQDNGEVRKCEICNVDFINLDDELLQCERCFNCNCCSGYFKMSKMYQMMSCRPDMHWFCSVCEIPAMSAVHADKEIEERCEAYFQIITDKIDKMQVEIGNKAENVEVESVKADIVTVSNRVDKVNSDFLSLRIELNCCIRNQKKRPSERIMWL